MSNARATFVAAALALAAPGAARPAAAGAPIAPAAASIPIAPGFFSYNRAAWAEGMLWIAADDQLWRFDLGGGAAAFDLPRPPVAILPRGENAYLLFGERLERFPPDGSPAIDLGFRPRNIVAVASGWIAVRGGAPRLFDPLGNPSWGTTWQPPVELDEERGTLVSLTSAEFAWVEDNPYRITFFHPDGGSNTVSVDETGFESLALEPAEIAPGRPVRTTQTRTGALRDGRLFLDRLVRRTLRFADVPEELRERWQTADGKAPAPDEPIILPSSFVDVIDPASGALIERLSLKIAGTRSALGNRALDGQFLGMCDDQLVLYRGTGTPSRLNFVPWQAVAALEGRPLTPRENSEVQQRLRAERKAMEPELRPAQVPVEMLAEKPVEKPAEKPRKKHPLVGKAAPAFTLPDLGRGSLSLAALGGQPAILGFWATWCLPCRAEMDLLEKLQQALRGKVTFVMASTDEPGQWKRLVGAIVKEKGYTMRFVHADEKVQKDWAVDLLPSLFVLDREGRVRSHHLGFDENLEKTLLAELRALQ